MALRQFELVSELPVTAEEAYAWHTRPGAFERLSPPWEGARVLERHGDLSSGLVTLEIPIGPLRQRWVARHRDAVPGRQFVDEQIEGPFARWVHAHLFEPVGTDRCRYIDRVEYELPLGAAGEVAAGYVAGRLAHAFRYRHLTLQQDFAAHHRYPAQGPLDIAITGANGFLGRRLIPFLTTGGHRVRSVVRRPMASTDIRWNPADGLLDGAALNGVDAVIHLAGAPIAAGRWTAERRRQIMESRTTGTTLLAETLAQLPHPPKVLISASAIGIYGDRGAEELTEESPLRTGANALFVERVGHAWEAGTEAAERAGIRVVRLRIGIVLTPGGGALGQMLPAFRAGVGGRLGSGAQFMSWIGIDDVLGAMLHLLRTEAIQGPVNATAPEPVTNAEFTRELGRVLARPALLPVPATALRLLFGEMADELLLSSLRVRPVRLLRSGYPFRQPTLIEALRHVLGR